MFILIGILLHELVVLKILGMGIGRIRMAVLPLARDVLLVVKRLTLLSLTLALGRRHVLLEAVLTLLPLARRALALALHVLPEAALALLALAMLPIKELRP